MDPARAIVATVPVSGGWALSAGSGALWVSRPDHGAVQRIDATTNRAVATITVNDPAKVADHAGVTLLASGSGQVWADDMVHQAVARIDPATNKVVATVPLGFRPFSLAIAGDTLWVKTSYEDFAVPVQTIARLDLRTGKVVATLPVDPLGQPFDSMAATPDALWFADWSSSTIKRLDAATNRVVATIPTGPRPSSLAAGAGAVWVLSRDSAQVMRIDPRTNTVVATIRLDGFPGGPIGGDCCLGTIAVGAGAVWAIAGTGARTLVRIDPHTNQATAALTFAQSIGPVVAAEGRVWVAQYTDAGGSYVRIDPQAMAAL
jgi:DNA-binding beta-propeller fold protein YncE